jgi:hypothetical protein
MSLKTEMTDDMATFFSPDEFAETAIIDGTEVSVMDIDYFDDNGIQRDAVSAATASLPPIRKSSTIKLSSGSYHITTAFPEPGDAALTTIILGAKR